MRTKWLQFFSPIDLMAIQQALRSCPYVRDAEIGFELIDRQDFSLECKFIERIVGRELLRDPFGSEQAIETIRYEVVNFTLIDVGLEFLVLRVDNPGRSIKRFLEVLYELFGFGTAVRPCILDIQKIVQKLRETHEFQSFKVERARVSGIPLSVSGTARVEAVSNVDAIKEIANAFDLSHAAIDRVCIKFAGQEGALTAEISRTGMMVYPKSVASIFSAVSIDYIRNGGGN